VFQAADLDGNGFMSNREIEKFLKGNNPMMERISLGVPFKWRLFLDELHSFDANQDGRIDNAEFVNFWVAQCRAGANQERSPQKPASPHPDVVKAFQAQNVELETEVEQLRQMLKEMEQKEIETIEEIEVEREQHSAEIQSLKSELENGPRDGGADADAAEASRAALLAVADANAKLQGQVSMLNEQRTTLSSGLDMAQKELDAQHQARTEMEAELAELKARAAEAPAGLPAPSNTADLIDERDELRLEVESLNEERTSLNEAYENIMMEHGSLEAKVDDLEQNLKMTRQALEHAMAGQ